LNLNGLDGSWLGHQLMLFSLPCLVFEEPRSFLGGHASSVMRQDAWQFKEHRIFNGRCSASYILNAQSDLGPSLSQCRSSVGLRPLSLRQSLQS